VSELLSSMESVSLGRMEPCVLGIR
jgi:hypothetical protein